MTAFLIFPSLHICFTASGHALFNNARRTNTKKKKEKNQSQCAPRTSESLDEKEISIHWNHRLVGILKEVSEVNTVLIRFISKSVIKHHTVQNSLAVNLPTETVGTVVLALQQYPMMSAFLWSSDMKVCLAQVYICLCLPKCTCWGCTPL